MEKTEKELILEEFTQVMKRALNAGGVKGISRIWGTNQSWIVVMGNDVEWSHEDMQFHAVEKPST